MAKRKSEDNPTTTAANGELAASNKKRRMSDEEAPAKQVKKDKKDKKDRKTKKSKKDAEIAPEEDVVDIAMTELDDIKPVAKGQVASAAGEAKVNTSEPTAATEKTKKKRRKNKKAVKEDGDEEKPAGTAEDGADASRPAKKSRFIVFVGNLPFSATVQDIEKHFSAVKPISIRLLHEKANPTKSRGIAFVEFAGFDHMKTCLKTLHHSTITCQGRDHRGDPKPEERQINVELTAGGGGNTDGRKEKIKAKNVKLNEQRERRAIEEEKQKIKKEQERLTKEGEKGGGPDGIHPSRRTQIPRGRK